MNTEAVKQAIEEASRYLTEDIPDDLKKLITDAIGRSLENKQFLKEKLLKEAKCKEPRFFFEIDGFANISGGDSIMEPDEEGDCMFSFNTWELKNSDNEVRVLVHEGSKPEDVLRLLKKICKWIKSEPEMITDNYNRNNGLENGRLGSFPFKTYSDDMPF